MWKIDRIIAALPGKGWRKALVLVLLLLWLPSLSGLLTFGTGLVDSLNRGQIKHLQQEALQQNTTMLQMCELALQNPTQNLTREMLFQVDDSKNAGDFAEKAGETGRFLTEISLATPWIKSVTLYYSSSFSFASKISNVIWQNAPRPESVEARAMALATNQGGLASIDRQLLYILQIEDATHNPVILIARLDAQKLVHQVFEKSPGGLRYGGGCQVTGATLSIAEDIRSGKSSSGDMRIGYTVENNDIQVVSFQQADAAFFSWGLLLWILATYILVTVMICVYAQWQQQRDQQSKNRQLEEMANQTKISQKLQREAELKALQTQLDPHFLYNALSSLSWMALRAGNQEIVSTVSHLSRFYRSSLSGGKSFGTVSDQMQQIEDYLTIYRLTSDHAFESRVYADDEAKPMQMLNFLLQPLVENSLKHGIEPLSGGGSIEVLVERKGETLSCTVSDNGVGMDAQTLARVQAGRVTGYGVGIVRDRIKYVYGDHAKMTISSAPSQGTTINLLLPMVLPQDSITLGKN